MRLARPVILGAAALAAGVAAPAGAGNWTLSGNAFERIEGSSNPFLSEDGEPLVGSVTGVDLELGYDTRRTEWGLGSGVSYRHYVGPGDDDSRDGLSDPRVSGSVAHRGKRQQIAAEFEARRQPIEFREFEELGDFELVDEVQRDATETDLDVAVEWSWLATPRSTFTLGSEVNLRRFSEESETLTPSTSVLVSGGWSRAWNARTDVGVNLSYRNVQSDGELQDRESDILWLGIDAERLLTKRHTLTLNAGLGHVSTEITRLPPLESVSDTGLAFVGDLQLDWIGPQGFEARMTASQALEPTLEGDLASTLRLGAEVARPLTRQTRVSVDGTYARRVAEESFGGDGEQSQLFSLGARLSGDLSRHWEASAGTGLTYRVDDESSAQALGFFLELRRELVLNR